MNKRFGRPDPASVYVVRSGRFIKVGKANDVQARLRTFQTGTPHRLELLWAIETYSSESAMRIERLLHRDLDTLGVRTRGEWFDLTPEAVAIIRTRGVYYQELGEGDQVEDFGRLAMLLATHGIPPLSGRSALVLDRWMWTAKRIQLTDSFPDGFGGAVMIHRRDWSVDDADAIGLTIAGAWYSYEDGSRVGLVLFDGQKIVLPTAWLYGPMDALMMDMVTMGCPPFDDPDPIPFVSAEGPVRTFSP
ncbi:MAG: GIY-YIG nuclease family protein [Ardenticatenales bacterium]